MIVTKENERLFCKTWTYNAARILSELAQVVENNGGRVKDGHAAIISGWKNSKRPKASPPGRRPWRNTGSSWTQSAPRASQSG